MGGKAASLGELHRAGLPVPPAFVVTTVGFTRALEALDPGGELRDAIGRLADDDTLPERAAEMRQRVQQAPLPDDLHAAIVEAYTQLGDGEEDTPVAVRSSATAEDSDDASFAGLQDTYLWVRGTDDVLEHVRRCWASLYNPESVSYRRRHDLPEAGLAMAVAVQQMVDARVSGVMFTCSPTTGDRSVVALEASWGLGSAMVSGEVTPDTFTVNKVTGEVVRRETADKHCRHVMDPGGRGVVSEEVPEALRTRPALTDEQLEVLVDLARRVERHRGRPQDIEWAIPAGGTDTGVVLLQSRPETVWSQRSSEPVAAPKKRAFDHVLGALSGDAKRRNEEADV